MIWMLSSLVISLELDSIEYASVQQRPSRFTQLGTCHEWQDTLNCGCSSVFASWRKRTVDFCFHLKKRCLVSWFLFFSHVSIFIFKLVKFYLSIYILQLVVFYIAIYSVFRMLNVVVITKYNLHIPHVNWYTEKQLIPGIHL